MPEEIKKPYKSRIAESVLPHPGTERILATSTFVNTIGNGVFSVAAVLYFNQVLKLSPHRIALVFTAAAMMEIAATFPAGYFSDRFSPRTISLVSTVVLGLLQALLVFVTTFGSLLVIMGTIGLVDGFNRTARSALVARIGGADGRVRLRAYLRAVTNVGIALGAGIAGLAITIDTSFAYRSLIILDAVTYLVAAFVLLRLEHVPVHPQAHSHSVTLAIRDWRYVTLSLMMALIGLHYLILDIVLPVWVVSNTSAPKPVVAVIFLINTVMVALLQVRASVGTESPIAAAHAIRQSSVILLIACLIYPISTFSDNGMIAALVLCVAAVIHVFGELRQAAGSWGIGFGLPPESAQGQYQAIWGLNMSASRLAGPIVLIWLCIEHGAVGWVILGLIFLSVGMLTVPLVHSAIAAQGTKESTSIAARDLY